MTAPGSDKELPTVKRLLGRIAFSRLGGLAAKIPPLSWLIQFIVAAEQIATTMGPPPGGERRHRCLISWGIGVELGLDQKGDKISAGEGHGSGGGFEAHE